MRWRATQPRGLPAIKASQEWSRARNAKDVDADAQAKLGEAPWSRKAHSSLG